MTPIALTIAGSDPSGGAGIQADLKTFHQRNVYGMSVLTLLTVQNTCSVDAVEPLAPGFVLAQLDSVLADLPPHAAKTGALGTCEIIEAIARRAAHFSFPLVVDPVMISKHGALLLPEEAQKTLVRELLPHAALVTPNLYEASVLSGRQIKDPSSMESAAKDIAQLGPRAVLIKGGHLSGEATDLLYADGLFHLFSARRVETAHTHGTGCTYSAAITAELAKGVGLVAAIETAKRYITRAIETNPGLGRGVGPVNHNAQV
jgi:hydroxymethylpyrimidine/phosphomethylpyrimidine kinase